MNELIKSISSFNNNFINPYEFWTDCIFGSIFIIYMLLRQYYFNNIKFNVIYGPIFGVLILNLYMFCKLYLLNQLELNIYFLFFVVFNAMFIFGSISSYFEYKKNTK